MVTAAEVSSAAALPEAYSRLSLHGAGPSTVPLPQLGVLKVTPGGDKQHSREGGTDEKIEGWSHNSDRGTP
jgi:hypothetical protein